MVPAEWLRYAPKPKPLTGDNKWHVFLSYRSVNRAWVLNLYDVLVELGYKVFLDQYVLKPGDKLVSNLQDALEHSQSGILIWSSRTKESEWVNDEYETLQRKSNEDRNFIFVPVKIDDCELPTFAANRIYIDFTSCPDGPNGGDLLRLLHALAGVPLSDEAVHFALAQDEAAGSAIISINAALKNKRPETLIRLFQEGGLPWKTTAALGCKAADGLIRLKKNAEAITILEALEQEFKKALRPKQLMGLALARRGEPGDLEKAQDVLGELYALNHLDPETMGLYARTWMDRYTQSRDESDLLQSIDLYAEAFDKSPDDYYTGINAASKSIFAGTEQSIARGAAYAARVEQLVGTEEWPGDYWKTATVAEVALIQKKYEEAGAMYGKAVAMARSETASHESTWKQAGRLMDKLQPAPAERSQVLNAFRHLPDYLNYTL